MKVAIIGAGIVGIACAHALADEGHEIVLIDHDGPAAGASKGNAGLLAHTEIDLIASPKMLRQVPRFLLDPLGPLTIRPSYDWSLPRGRPISNDRRLPCCRSSDWPCQPGSLWPQLSVSET